MKRLFKYLFILCCFLFLFYELAFSETLESKNLLGYTGYLTIPSAYISNAQWSFGYSYFSESFPLTEELSIENNSEIWIFSSSLGLFPFMEILFSVYVLPQDNISDHISNYGANKWRTGGLKLKVVDEKKYFPAFSIGAVDPYLKEIGASKSAPNISSTYIVFSKHIFSDKNSFSLGYGSEYLSRDKDRVRLKGLFGGCRFNIYRNIKLLCDYDGRYWSLGNTFKWKNFDLIFSYIKGNYVASRIGYNFNLLKGIHKK